MTDSKRPYNFFIKNYAELTGFFVFLIYILTVGRSIGEFDSGELALAQATLSIPHPTGYPLFSLLGFLFSKIPLPISTLIKLNLLNPIWCTLTVIVLIKTSALLLNNLELIFNKRILQSKINFNIPQSYKIAISIFSGLMLAFSATFWLNAPKVESFILSRFFLHLL